MGLLPLFSLAVALSFDAMAVAAASGAKHPRLSIKKSLQIAGIFGFFQFVMPLIGFVIGTRLQSVIMSIDHWVAFGLLSLLALKMIMESFTPLEEKQVDIHSWKLLFSLAIATSIDALMVGIMLPLFSTNIWVSTIIIGVTTAILCYLAIGIGKKFGERWGKKAEVIGGIMLFLIGLKILLSHVFG